MDIEHDPDIRIERDGEAIRQVLHLSRPFTQAAHSPRDLALLYLHVHAEPFHLERAGLPSVPGMPSRPFRVWLARLLRAVPLLGPWLWPRLTRGIRLNPEPRLVTIRAGESVAVIFEQVVRVDVPPAHLDFPVRGAGIRIMVALAPLRVTGVYSTLNPEVPAAVRSQPFATTREAAAEALDIPLETVEGLFVDRRPTADGPRTSAVAPILVYGRVQDAGLGPLDEGRGLPYREHRDLVSGAVVRREVHASHADAVTGLVFPVDPPSQAGGAAPAPNRPASELDPFRSRRRLRDLVPAAASAQQGLQGLRVSVAPDNPLGIAPPTQPPGVNFDYTSRSSDFAAVSAYRHCDAAVRMIEAVGFPAASYFAANVGAGKFPLRVVHRAPIWPGPAVYDGRTVNAQVVGDGLANPSVVGELRFALGDLSDVGTRPPGTAIAPLGIAADVRFVWHEFCHALLIAATGSPEFPFAHSAGDALAAVICDLDSRVSELQPAWRGVTFPWVQALRRHDRRAAEGWGWHGSLYSPIRDMRDPGGYQGEQVLSSTLFRLYRALGGDAVQPDTTPDLAARRSAAAYTVYLVVSAIRALGPVATVPALDAYALAGALITSDIDTAFLLPDDDVFPSFRAPARRGGAVHKVVRWCFEQQGLYAPTTGSRPWDAPGQAEPVDLYIEDGRNGGYDYTAQWHVTAPHLRAAALPNPGAPDAPPHANAPSYVFVRVMNRGTALNPPAATVRVFAARAPSGPPRWRLAPGPFNRWVEQAPHPPGAVTTAVVPPGGAVDFGPFVWQPVAPGPHGLLACVDGPGDRCNALQPTYASAVGPTRVAHLVPFDNNLGYRGIDALP